MIGGRPASGDGTDREALSRPQAEDGIFGHGNLARLARLHLAGFDQVEKPNVAGSGANNLAARRVKGDLRLFGKMLQRLRFHFVERRVIAQKRNRMARHAVTPVLAECRFHLADHHFLP